MKPSGIGGQAVMEGVMMKNKDTYAVAVRKPNKEIIVEKKNYVSFTEKYKIFKLPILRGVLSFIESMVIGMKTLTFSASFFEEEETAKPSKVETAFSKIFKGKAENVIMGLTVILSIVLAVAIFMILPYLVAEFLQGHVNSPVLLAVMEGVIRIGIFIAYILAISQMKDIKRTFMYHGAEHKTINCLEHGFPLNVKNVRLQSKEHKRCGTSFVFIVMFISIIFFIFIRVDTVWLRVIVRLLLVPVIAGVAYEFIRLAGRSDSKVVEVLSKPGLLLQGLTTKEPNDEMIEVAIKSVETVFDWRAYLKENNIEFEEEPEQENTERKTVTLGNRKKHKKKITENKKSPVEKTAITATEGKVEEKAEEKVETEENEMETAAAFEHRSFVEEDSEEEEDEILRALDRYFIMNNNKEHETH